MQFIFHELNLNSFCVYFVIFQTSYGGKITLMTEETPLTVLVYHATTLSDKRYARVYFIRRTVYCSAS